MRNRNIAIYACIGCHHEDPIEDWKLEVSSPYQCRFCARAQKCADFLEDKAKLKMMPWQVVFLSTWLRKQDQGEWL